jgi:hypothetical protein
LGEEEETLSNQMFHIDGENAIYELIEFCKINNWQIFDTGLGQMIDLNNPSKNGYKNHQKYINYIKSKNNL